MTVDINFHPKSVFCLTCDGDQYNVDNGLLLARGDVEITVCLHVHSMSYYYISLIVSLVGEPRESFIDDVLADGPLSLKVEKTSNSNRSDEEPTGQGDDVLSFRR